MGNPAIWYLVPYQHQQRFFKKKLGLTMSPTIQTREFKMRVCWYSPWVRAVERPYEMLVYSSLNSQTTIQSAKFILVSNVLGARSYLRVWGGAKKIDALHGEPLQGALSLWVNSWEGKHEQNYLEPFDFHIFSDSPLLGLLRSLELNRSRRRASTNLWIYWSQITRCSWQMPSNFGNRTPECIWPCLSHAFR